METENAEELVQKYEPMFHKVLITCSIFRNNPDYEDYLQIIRLSFFEKSQQLDLEYTNQFMLTVAEAAAVAKKHQLPLIVDAAAEEDLYKYSKAGADLVIYSGAKAIEGPSSGLVIGKGKYIEWIRLQGKGIGRAMKIGKDNILGLTQALEDRLANGSETGDSMKKRLAPFIEAINQIDGLKATVVQDGAGRDIYRASVKVLERSAKEVIAELKAEDPAIYTREYQANNGIIEFDIRAVNEEEMNKIVTRLKAIM